MIELWKDIKNYEGLYKISNQGRVKSLHLRTNNLKKGNIIKQRENINGYLIIGLTKNNKQKTLRVHRLVATEFKPNQENKPCVNHIDGNKLNNNDWNIEWCTYSENHIHAYKNNLMNRKGEAHNNSKLKNEDIVFIIKSKMTSKELSKKFSINQNYITQIKRRKRWKHLNLKIYNKQLIGE